MKPRPIKAKRNLHHEAVRGEILEAAARAIAENGYHGMSMRALARATGMALANFYNYFSSKEGLLFALQTDAFQTLNRTVEKAVQDVSDPVAGLYVFIYSHLCYVAEHRAIMRVLIHEASALPRARRTAIRALKERYFETGRRAVKAILEDGCRNGAGRGYQLPDEAETERATYSIFGMLNWSYGWYEPRRHGTPHDVAATIHRIALCGLVAECPHRPVQKRMQKHLSTVTLPPLIGSTTRESEMR